MRLSRVARDCTAEFAAFCRGGDARGTGRAVQAECEQMEGVVLRICIRPLDGAYVLLAIMDIRAHLISFWERP